MERTFAIIAEPSRRAILSLLATSERSVGDIEERLQLSQPSVSKHLRVLREAGFVQSRVDAQRRLYRIRPEPLMEIDAWLAPFRRFWSARIDALSIVEIDAEDGERPRTSSMTMNASFVTSAPERSRRTTPQSRSSRMAEADAAPELLGPTSAGVAAAGAWGAQTRRGSEGNRPLGE